MDRTIKLTFVGDIMCKADMLQPYYENGVYNFTPLFASCKQLLSVSDFASGNLETPISLNNSGLSSSKYCFNTPFEFAQSVKDVGFSFVATANNHCLDRGIEGIDSTIKSLETVGLLHTGIFSNKKKVPIIADIKGIKVGFLSYTYGTNAFANKQYLQLKDLWRVNLLQMQELWNPITRYLYYNGSTFCGKVYWKITSMLKTHNYRKQIYERIESSWVQRLQLRYDLKNMKKFGADLIVVFMHAGGQYNDEATDSTKSICKFLRRNGANIIVGSHEHVVHGCSNEFLSCNSVETYSLGNFCGIAGVYADPMDKMAEYSIAWHVYVNPDTKQIGSTSFSILKTIKANEDGMVCTVPVFDLLKRCGAEDNYKKLWNDMKTIAKRFAGITITEVKKEYFY